MNVQSTTHPKRPNGSLGSHGSLALSCDANQCVDSLSDEGLILVWCMCACSHNRMAHSVFESIPNGGEYTTWVVVGTSVCVATDWHCRGPEHSGPHRNQFHHAINIIFTTTLKAQLDNSASKSNIWYSSAEVNSQSL